LGARIASTASSHQATLLSSLSVWTMRWLIAFSISCCSRSIALLLAD